MGTNYMHEIEI